jgi:hypothetical protein
MMKKAEHICMTGRNGARCFFTDTLTALGIRCHDPAKN